MKEMIADKKLLVIDDKVEYLDAARAAYESIKDTFGYEVTFCDSFDRGVEEVKSRKYTHILTDLFEGEETPKGLLVLIAAKEEDIPARIVTDGNRHYGTLGSIRYGLHPSQGEGARGAKELAAKAPELLKKVELTREETMQGIGPKWFEDYLIGEPGTGGHAKSTVEDWKEIYALFDAILKPRVRETVIKTYY